MTHLYTPVFTVYPDNLGERWQLIRRFADQIYEAKIPWSSRVPATVQRLESTLDHKLPLSVVEWMMFGRDLKKHCERAASDFAHLKLSVRQNTALDVIELAEVYEESRRWAVSVRDLKQDDPPVGSYAYIRGKRKFVFRRNHGQMPLTDFAVQLLTLSGCGAFSRQGGPLDDPDAFLASLPKSVSISPRIGGMRLVESNGWFAMVLNGKCLDGEGKQVVLHFQARGKLKDYPKPLRDAVQLTPRSLKPRVPWPEEPNGA